MALLFLDSFDHYATADLLRKWTQVPTSAQVTVDPVIGAYGRRSTSGLRCAVSGSTTQARCPVVTLPASGSTFGCGFAFTPTGAFNDLTTGTNGASSFANSASNALMAVRYQGTGMFWIRVNTDGTLSVYSGTSVLGTSVSAISPGTTYYVELKVVIHASTGTVDLEVDGSSWLSLSNQNTGSTAWNEFFLGKCRAGSAKTWDFDDVYVFDGITSDANNQVVDLLGDVRVDALVPNGVGATSGWTPSGGSPLPDNYECIDDATPNDDTDYVSTSTLNAIDTYAFPDAPVVGATVLGIQVCSCERRETVGSSQTAGVLRTGGTDYPATAVGNPSTYAYNRGLWTLNPSDQSVIDDTDFNAMEFGIKKTA